MLDSSPVALPPVSMTEGDPLCLPRPLKRSASVASLPTPPRTRHRKGKKRGRPSRGSFATDSDSDLDVTVEDGGSSEGSDEAEGSDDEERINVHKRRRMKDKLEDEDAFWLGGDDDGVVGKGIGRQGSLKAVASDPGPETMHRDGDVDAQAPLLYRRLQRSQSLAQTEQTSSKKEEESKPALVSTNTTLVAPVSPPPSNRRAAVTKTLSLSAATLVKSPPATPKPKARVKQRARRVFELPQRDTPNNPFLDSPVEREKAKASAKDGTSPHTPPPLEERPTVTYVFRGIRGVYPNPLYNHAKKRPRTPPPESRLPLDHPDFSPDMRCPPRLLFPTRPRKENTSQPQPLDSLDPPTTPTRDRSRYKNPGPPAVFGKGKGKTRDRDDSDTLKMPQLEQVANAKSRGQRTRSALDHHVLGESDDEDDTGREGEAGDEGSEGDVFGKIRPTKLDFGAKKADAALSRTVNIGERDKDLTRSNLKSTGDQKARA
ncbi:hypothetical protein AX17_005682 [Amanita inopinata Kibby_2008]|nr:hypothetical protein AX17_005682 [Amanita inopinata Kibby_2008]